MTTYYIASLKHTNNQHEHITWWAKNHCGYTPVLGESVGEYTQEEAEKLNDGRDCIAVPVAFVRSIQANEPYYKPGARFYDQRGPVVDNTRAIWNQIIANSMESGRERAPRPTPFRGQRRSFACVPAAQPA